MSVARASTAVDRLAEDYLDAATALDPIEATDLGVSGYDDTLPDLSPDWYAQVSQLRQRTLADLSRVQAADTSDRITIAALRDQLEAAEDLRALGADEADLNNISSPLQRIRECFDSNATTTVDDWSIIATRMAAVPTAVAGYVQSLRFAAARGRVGSRRQLRAGIAQCQDIADDDGFFASLASDAAAVDGTPLPASVRTDLERNASLAGHAYSVLAGFLAEELMARAPEQDGVGGPEAYAVHSRAHLGCRIDLEETYAWGQDELARIVAEMAHTADRIQPGATVEEATAFLDADPRGRLEGPGAFQSWMQDKSDAAVDALAGTHFDIPEPIRRLECRIAATHTGGVYYTGPSEDLITRPGRMWWSVPEGVSGFSGWRWLTSVYHEGVPGHHLQMAQTVYRRELLNRWRRSGSWVSGHGEGWALYAERLMADLGFLDDAGDYLGMLDGQSLRAARVVLDIGVHCGFPAPSEVGGGDWTYDKAAQFLRAHATMAEEYVRFELERYYGCPGQAPAYKIGERLWLQLREQDRARQGSGFELKQFHRRALDIGSVGLDVLRGAVLGRFDQ